MSVIEMSKMSKMSKMGINKQIGSQFNG